MFVLFLIISDILAFLLGMWVGGNIITMKIEKTGEETEEIPEISRSKKLVAGIIGGLIGFAAWHFSFLDWCMIGWDIWLKNFLCN